MIGKLRYEKDKWYVELPAGKDDFGMPIVGQYIEIDPDYLKYYFLDEDDAGKEVAFDFMFYSTGQYAKLVKPEEESVMVTQLREHLDSITSEEFDKEIEEIENLHGDGVTILDDPHIYDERDFIGEAERSRAIDFAKWLAQDWMSIWVGDKWMWECQTDNVHLGYKTEEELYELYLKSV